MICIGLRLSLSFKPYYKWITFNTKKEEYINDRNEKGFKPYYKWITFNTIFPSIHIDIVDSVLNLIING